MTNPSLRSDQSALGAARRDDGTDTGDQDGDRSNANPHTRRTGGSQRVATRLFRSLGRGVLRGRSLTAINRGVLRSRGLGCGVLRGRSLSSGGGRLTITNGRILRGRSLSSGGRRLTITNGRILRGRSLLVSIDSRIRTALVNTLGGCRA